MTTILTPSSTLPATLSYTSVGQFPGRLIADAGHERPLWELMTWPARKPTLTEIYWLAGFFDGEGSFGAYGGPITIPQKDPELLYRVRTLFGGKVDGPYARIDRRTGRRYQIHRWWASGARGRGIARTLFHLLSSRRQLQARIYLRIARDEVPPPLDPLDPARLLWDWAPPGEDLE